MIQMKKLVVYKTILDGLKNQKIMMLTHVKQAIIPIILKTYIVIWRVWDIT